MGNGRRSPTPERLLLANCGGVLAVVYTLFSTTLVVVHEPNNNNNNNSAFQQPRRGRGSICDFEHGGNNRPTGGSIIILPLQRAGPKIRQQLR
ncbi:hypothetical protein T01_14873 [Trichinella spiralis]|uniref:Uncharacterized protein n=1 Tax=Trichinella spiralis TaxID=6334 RepID=A0A0V1B2L1_TRISP|nr:hypothetical protein T01_14873 [Trichinella spiralis]